MANKKSQGRGNAKAQGGKPNWTPYLVAAGVALVAMAVYSAIYSMPGSENRPSARRSSAREGPSVEQLEAQLRNLHKGLAGVAGKGETGVFQKIAGMAGNIQDALDRSANASSEEEQREILEAALATKADMLSALADRTKTLREEEAEDQRQHAPVMLDPNGHVAKLTKDTFANFLSSNPRTMVEFYAPWCGHCKKFAPEYEKTAEQFHGRAGFAAVDATAETQLSRIYNVGGYPTLKWFVHGRPLDYEGPRAAAPLAKWVEDHLKPAYQELDAEEDLGSSLEAALSAASAGGGGGIALNICAGSGPKVSKAFRAFEVASEKFRGKMLFLWSAKANEEPSLSLYRTGKEPEPCPGPCESDDEVIAWIEKARERAEVEEFDQE